LSTLILVRHGESEWNSQNLFTGWVDVPLSQTGREEAREGGERLAAEGIRVDRAFTSTLRRAIDTGQIVLDALGQGDLEQVQAWQLNERYYGALTGRNKKQTAEEFGDEQVHVWRRSYATPPPGGESLADTARRTLPYFEAEVLPATDEVDVVLVSAHGNSLRAIVKDLEGLSDDEIPGVEIPTGVPIVYEIDNRKVVGKRVLSA
jgi:2,3-bisphosphoglycerate-dependent phosphoglycerate mutase